MSADAFMSLGWIGGAAAAVVLVWVIWWALYGDAAAARGQDRRRCPECWHDLSGTPGRICGECGHEAADEAALHRVRRRWSIAGLALAILLGGASAVQWTFDSHGWTQLVPTRGLIALVSWSDGDRSPVYREIFQRLNAAQFSESQKSALLSACLRGDLWARPGSPAWRHRYAPYLEWWQRPKLAAEAQRARLLELPVDLHVASPAVWLADGATCLHLQVSHWWPYETECRVTVRPRVEGAEPQRVIRTAGDAIGPPFPVIVPPPATGVESVVLEIAVERRPAPEDGSAQAAADWVEVAETEISVPVKTLVQAAQWMTPVDSEEMRLAIARVFAPGLHRWEDGPRRYGLRFNSRATSVPEFEGVAIGLEVEVCEAGVPRRRSRIWWLGGPSGGRPAWEISTEDLAALDRASETDGRWTLRVRGRPELAVRALSVPEDWPPEGDGSRGSGDLWGDGGIGEEATARRGRPLYWGGEFEMPLRLVERPGRSPRRLWRWELDEDWPAPD